MSYHEIVINRNLIQPDVWIVPEAFCAAQDINVVTYFPKGGSSEAEGLMKEMKNNIQFLKARSPSLAKHFKRFSVSSVSVLCNTDVCKENPVHNRNRYEFFEWSTT